jgi:DNA-binding CsgD family transcriptional regulator
MGRLNVGMLIERARHVASLEAALDDALEGRGRLVFVGGEAGIGKTTLVGEAARLADGRVRVLRGVFDNVTTPAPFGALVDASDVFAELVDEAVNRAVLFRRMRAALAETPTLLVLEDVHWADEATLDLLRFVGRRLDGTAVLVVATYRLDEVAGARHPLAVVLGDLATETAVSRLGVEPLSLAAVTELVVASGSAIDPAALHDLTGGNAFYVTEVLAAPDDIVPQTVRDAVLARTARLSDAAQQVLGAAVVLGQPVDALMLADVAGRDVRYVDECAAHGLLVPERDRLGFRHDLARRAVEETLSPGQLLELHRSVFAALRARGVDDDRRLAWHAAASGERAAARLHAGRAADRATQLGAHREAAVQYRLALQQSDDDLADRTALLVALSYECYLIGDIPEAIVARTRAMEFAELADDAAAVGAHQRWLSRMSWFLARNVDAERYADRAITTLEPFGDGHELGMAYSNKAQLAMLKGDVAAAEQWGHRAIDLARRIGDREVEIHALNNVGTAQGERDDSIEGRALLARSLDLALADDAHEHAARAYTNLGATAVLNRRFQDGEGYLRAGIAYSMERDLDSWSLYMNGFLSRALCEMGRQDEALACALDVLRNERLSAITRIVAATVVGQIVARRGEDAHEWLDQAWELAANTGEQQRLAPAAVAMAEAAWSADETMPVAALDLAWTASTALPSDWIVAEVAYWRAKAGLPTDTEVAFPAPFALMRDGEWRAAARAWQAFGCPLWQAHALAQAPDLDAAREAFELCAKLGAPATWTALARDRYAAGLRVPRGPRPARAANPAGLTARELEILRLLARDLSNAEIAAELFLSTKTVDHHVSAVLRKLDEPTRRRAVATANQRGLLAAPT